MPLLDLLLERAIMFIPVLLSLTVHEWAHAWTAWRLGDDTAKLLGRVSLNPVDHMDPVGTLLLPILGIPFGWAKPVPVNPIRFHDGVSMHFGLLLTAAAGPISNFLLAAVCLALLAVFHSLAGPAGPLILAPDVSSAIMELLQYMVLINTVLALFNLLPIPPLDGSRIMEAIIPDSLRKYWNELVAAGPLLLLGVILAPLLFGVNIFYWPIRWASELQSLVLGQ